MPLSSEDQEIMDRLANFSQFRAWLSRQNDEQVAKLKKVRGDHNTGYIQGWIACLEQLQAYLTKK